MDLAAQSESVRAATVFRGERWPGPTLALLCSRLGRPLEQHAHLFAALRTAVAQLPASWTVLAAADQTLFPFLVRLAAWYPFELCAVTVSTKDDPPAFRPRSPGAGPCGERRVQRWIVPPPLGSASPQQADELVANLADEVRVLHIRPNGNVAAAVGQALRRSARVLIWSGTPQEDSAVVANLRERGALPWVVLPDADPVPAVVAGHTPPIAATFRAASSWIAPQIVPLAALESRRYLAHFVRGGWGPWGDESEAAYLDRLLFARDRISRDGLATLQRILAQQRIVAGNRLTRGAARVVCFTAQPLGRFASLRKFRRHVGRWDFEPFGIAIERDHFRQLGGRPVRYGTDRDWERLSPADQPFFQLAESRNGKQVWREEREWRLLGDLDLQQLDPQRVVAFVPDQRAADEIRDCCPFRIVLLHSGS